MISSVLRSFQPRLIQTLRTGSALLSRLPATRAPFTSTTLWRSQAGAESDLDLAKVLNQEYEYEKQAEGVSTTLPAKLKSYLDKSPFKIQSQEGSREVQLVRTFGKDETIAVTLNIVPEVDMDGEDMMEEEETEVTEEETEAESVFFNVTIDIKKKDGTMTFYAIADGDSEFYINEVEFTSSTEDVNSAEQDYKRRSKYLGPRFADLDNNLQDAFAGYLEERGFDGELCQFIQEYAEWKEQTEYMQWLKQLKDFVKQ